ncbi:MAG: PhnD/SsuA/transferrin family substrate-binding protein [Pseudomonadota bacterium]
MPTAASKALDDTKGKKLGFADPNSTSGYLIPSIELVEKVGELRKFFEKTQFMGGHENGVLGVFNKDVDVAVIWFSGVGEWSEGYTSGNLRKMVDKGILNMDDIVQVRSSKLIPNGPIVMPTELPRGAHDMMVSTLPQILPTDGYVLRLAPARVDRD